MTTEAVPIITFTPSAMPPDLLERIFVEREPLAKRVSSSIKKSITSPAKHHWLLVGPRGIGKTHFVSVIYYRLRKDKRLQNKVRVAWLREESWEVASYADFLDAVLRALAVEYIDDTLAEEHDALLDVDQAEAARAAEDLLVETLGDRTLLLIVENLDEIFQGLGQQGQRALRAFLENTDRCVILATTTSLFNDVSRHSASFYGFFTVHHLQELDLESAKELLTRVAELRQDTELLDFLRSAEAYARLRVIQELAGGHPRIWVLFANCVSVQLIDELVPLFIKMLDDLTPYYQERLRNLPPQQRRIAVHLATIRGAQPVKETARAVRLSQQSTAKLLGDLESKGFVQRAVGIPDTARGDRRLTAYELREPLMRLALDIKESRGKPLRLIVAFLRDWFGEDLFKIGIELPPDTLAGEYVREALAEVATRPPSDRLLIEVSLFILTRLLMRTVEEFASEPLPLPTEQLPYPPFASLEQMQSSTYEWVAAWGKSTDGKLLSQAMVAPLLVLVNPLMLYRYLQATGATERLATTFKFHRQAIAIWVDAWSAVAKGQEALDIAYRLLQAAAAYQQDQDRKHLLALPVEERQLLTLLIEWRPEEETAVS